MWRYVFSRTWRQPLKSLFAISGFLLTSCALVLLSSTTQTAVVQANQGINQNWRPAYDLVVLPPGSNLPANQPIPPDYMQRFSGGISFAQYDAIKQISGIDVAAPVAYVGGMSLPEPNVYFGKENPGAGYFQEDWTTTAFNGQGTLVEAQQHQIIFLGPELCKTTQDVIDQLLQKGVLGYACLGAGDGLVNFGPPDVGHYLLAAIDPQAEDRLMHLNKSITQGRMLTAQDTVQNDPRLSIVRAYSRDGTPLPIKSIPLLVHDHLPGQIQTQARFTYLASDDLSFQQVLQHGGASYLQQQPHQKIVYAGPVPVLFNSPQNLGGASLQWDGQKWQTSLPDPKDLSLMSQFIASFSRPFAPSGLSYRPVTGPAGQAAYTLVPTGAIGPEVTFRKLQPLKTRLTQMKNVLYSYDVVGAFSDSAVTPQFSNPLNWLPENTYTVAPTTLRYDAQGHPVAPTQLIPTTNSLGSLLQPPLALTTLDAARELRQDNIISTIRIRVAGVENASDASWQRVQQVATQIQQRTHLPVQVTLGSSPKSTLVFVPGLKQGQNGATQDIAPLGWVEERWITTGTSLRYLHQSQQTQNLLLWSVLAVSLGYLLVTLSSLAAAQKRDFAILSALGWRPWQPALMFLQQALMYALTGGLLGIASSLLLVSVLGAFPDWQVVWLTLPGILLLALLCALAPLGMIWRIQPAVLLKGGRALSRAASSPRRSWLTRRLQLLGEGPFSALLNLMRSWGRTSIAVGSLFLSALLLILMIDAVLAFQQSLQGTLLGTYLLAQTAVPLLTGVIFTILFTFFNVVDLFLLQMRERQQEIGLLQTIGWRPWLVQRRFIREGLTMAGVGTIPGVLLARWILLQQHTMQHLFPLSWLCVLSVLVLMLVSGLATIPAMRATSHMHLSELLRAE